MIRIISLLIVVAMASPVMADTGLAIDYDSIAEEAVQSSEASNKDSKKPRVVDSPDDCECWEKVCILDDPILGQHEYVPESCEELLRSDRPKIPLGSLVPTVVITVLLIVLTPSE